MYTYDGNNHETYFLLKNEKVIAELFMGEDDAASVTEYFNTMPIELDCIGSKRSEIERKVLED